VRSGKPKNEEGYDGYGVWVLYMKETNMEDERSDMDDTAKWQMMRERRIFESPFCLAYLNRDRLNNLTKPSDSILLAQISKLHLEGFILVLTSATL
jgi:hypothetical protein